MKSLNILTSLTILLCFSNLFTSSTSSPLPYTLQLSLIPNKLHSSSQTPLDIISNVAKSTLQRAHHIKHHSAATKSSSSSSSHLFTPLFARSAGDYSISLSIGTPPQSIPTFFDTGSSLVWVPCTSKYSCSNCTTPTTTTKIATFKPRLSSSKKHINCHNPKCQWLDEPDNTVSCAHCNRTLPGDCIRPCSYIQTYGAGDTSGNAIFETLNFHTNSLPGIFVGCSLISDLMPEGIVGFGRNAMSLPNQLKLTQFSYCLVSHKFDDTTKSSNLILGNSNVVAGVSYTPLLKNPNMLPFSGYYYVQLEQITINNKIIKLPRKILTTDPSGNGGTIVDSGSTLTSLAPSLFSPVANEYIAQLAPSQRKHVVIGQSSLGNLLCVNFDGEKGMVLPNVVFHFKGGAKMDLPVGNYINGGSGLLCLPFVNVTFQVGLTGSGPAVILGNYQQQNYYVEYDLRNQRLGFKKQIC